METFSKAWLVVVVVKVRISSSVFHLPPCAHDIRHNELRSKISGCRKSRCRVSHRETRYVCIKAHATGAQGATQYITSEHAAKHRTSLSARLLLKHNSSLSIVLVIKSVDRNGDLFVEPVPTGFVRDRNERTVDATFQCQRHACSLL